MIVANYGLFVHMLGGDVLSQASSVLCELAKLLAFCGHAWRGVLSQASSVLWEIDHDCGEIMVFLNTCLARMCGAKLPPCFAI